MVLLVIVRHGQSTYNLSNRFTGCLDVPLTRQGEFESKQAGEKLKGICFDMAFTSLLKRANASLDIILKGIHQTTIPIMKSAALNERRYGRLEGLNKIQTTEKFGEQQVQLWRRSYDVKPLGGESLEDTFNRTIPYYKSDIEPLLRANKNLLIVAHGNSLRALMMYLEHISTKAIIRLNIPTALPRLYHFDKHLKIESVSYL